jgi:hypothetical protein
VSAVVRDEHHREDLLAEATALVERAQFQTSEGASIVVGFRRDGSPSVFFDDDLVYQFNARGELRRAHAAGKLYKAEAGGLASLDRHRVSGQVQFRRHDLNPAETDAFLLEMSRRFESFREALNTGLCRVVGQVPADVDVSARVRDWLQRLPSAIVIARTPRVGG